MINRNWQLRQESLKKREAAAAEPETEPEAEVKPEQMEIEEPPKEAPNSSQNGNPDTSIAIEGGAEPIKTSKRSWRRSKNGSEKKKEKPEKNKVELLSIKVYT